MSITGILLAGGKSSRMGTEKGEVILRGRKMMNFPLDALEHVCDEIIISTCNKSFKSGEHRVICDEIPGLGPIGGIFTCLKKSGSEINIVLSYDMPFVTIDLLRHLIERSDNFEITAPSLENELPEPLCTVYKKSIIPVIEKLIREKKYSVHGLFPITKFNHVPIHRDLPFFNPYLFYNVNNPEEFEEIRRMIRSQNPLPGINHEGNTGE